MKRSPISKISKRGHPIRKRPELFFKPERLPFHDPRSYVNKAGRVRLYGVDYELLRWAAYMRATADYTRPAFCECGCGRLANWKPLFDGDPDAGDFAHNEHGARKSDELHRGKWMRHECHMRSHNCGGKPIKVTKKELGIFRSA